MPKKVILDHDGGVDDLVALVLLAAHSAAELIGVVVIDADCFVDDGHDVSRRVLAMLKHPVIPVAKSSLLGVHEFPKEWRKDATNMADFPCCNVPSINEELRRTAAAHAEVLAARSGEQVMADLVMGSDVPVTLVITGPLSNVAWCIDKYGTAFTSKVESVAILGGAVDVKGNVFLSSTDGSAEWNIYWDAPAAATVLSCTTLKCVLFSLDSTNAVPVTSEFVRKFGLQNEFLLSQFVGSSWGMCTHFIKLFGPDNGYYAWDVLTSAYVIDQTLVTLDPVKLSVVTNKDARDEGRTFRDEAHGNVVFVARNTDANKFYSMVLDVCRR